jgi:hypothetical protein
LLTVSEQRACQALRVEANQQKFESLRAKDRLYVPGGDQVVRVAGGEAVAAFTVNVQ